MAALLLIVIGNVGRSSRQNDFELIIEKTIAPDHSYLRDNLPIKANLTSLFIASGGTDSNCDHQYCSNSRENNFGLVTEEIISIGQTYSRGNLPIKSRSNFIFACT